MSTARRIGRLATVVAIVGATVPIGGWGTAADAVRTDTGLGGFSVKVEGAPVLVLVDDPNAAIPRPTGTAAAEGDPNYTQATVSTGPNAFGLASNLWPGNLLGTGLPAINENIPQYPLKVEARYPDGPFKGASPNGAFPGNSPDNDVVTSSSATGLDANAVADGAPGDQPGTLSIGGAVSHSTATVTKDDVATGTVISSVKNVNILGVIHIDSVTTTVTTRSDGKKPVSTGSTVVSGLTVNGVGYSVDDTGAHVGGQGVPVPPLVTPDQLKDLGISIEGIVQDASTTPTTAKRSAKGLTIRIDTTTFKNAIKPAIDALRDPYSTIVSTVIPPEYQSNFYYLLNATPNLSFVFGSAKSSSAAVLPLSFEFPQTGFPSFPSNPGVVGSPPVLPRDDTGFVAGPPTTGGSVPPAVEPVTPPVLQPPGTTPVALAQDADFTGITASKLLLALLFAGGVGWGLTRLLGVAGGLPLGLGCRLGAPTSVPDFRSVTA